MFNGYHEPPGTAYNDLDVDRGKKKWPCGNGANIQSTHMHPQNHQPEIWCTKSPYIGLPNSVNTVPKCNCPSCYQLPENQSYQGDITWHRSWLSRTYPAPVSQDLVKFQANHHWENACLPAEAYADNTGAHYMQESGDKPLFYKSYPELRHADFYQPAVISTLKTSKIARKEDFPKPDESELGHHARFSSSVPNPGCGTFRSTADRRRMEEESGYPNQNEKYLNMESTRQQRTPGPYHLHPNRRAMLDSFSKSVPSNANQNRVPSVGHHNIKDNVFHSYIDQSNIGKISSYNANQGVTKDKHCRSLYQPDVTKELNPGQENLRTGLLNTFSPAPVDCHGIGFNRDFENTLDRDYQKYMNSRNPQYLQRNNICDVIFRNCQNYVVDSRKDYSVNRKGVMNTALGSPRAAQAPPKYMDVALSKSPAYGKLNSRDCAVSGRVSSDLKLMINPNGKESYEGYQKADDIIHGHYPRTHGESTDPFAAEKVYNPFPYQNPAYKGPRRPEHSFRDMQLPYDQANGMMNLKGNASTGINQEQIPNFADVHASLETYTRVNNNLSYDGSCQQFEKLHDQTPSENKAQPSVFVGHQTQPSFFEDGKNLRQSEKEDLGKISHLESIRYEELCKNGTSKISPLRLLRKKKFTQAKREDAVDAPTQDADASSKSATSPLDVRRFWATWAEEEDDNVQQTQMVVLDCHNIDPEQAGLLNLYNPEPVRAIQLDESNLLDVKSSQYESQCEQNVAPYKTLSFGHGNDEKVRDGGKTVDEKFKDEARSLLEESKYLSGPDLSYGMTLVMDSSREATTSSSDTKLNAVAPERGEPSNKMQTYEENVKQFDIFKYCEKDPERVLDDDHTSVKNGLADQVMSCDSEISSVLTRDDLEAEVSNVTNVKKIITDDFQSGSQIRGGETDPKTKESSPCSDSSDDSQTGDMSTASNLPTSEYRKNKFLDYTGDTLCNGSFSLKSMSCQVLDKEDADTKKTKDPDEVGEKLENLNSMTESCEGGQNDLEIDEILKKLSDINVQSPDLTGKGVESMNEILQKLKTDKRIIDRKEKKTKKLSHKSSRTDQVAPHNISVNKPKVKFSIQKSHDLKISLKVLSNEKKCDQDDTNEDNVGYKEITEPGYSSGGAEDNGTVEEMKKNRGEVNPPKVKGSPEESEKSKEDEEEGKKCKKFVKKKKIRLDGSPSPKTPVKVKKNRHKLNGSEKEGVDDNGSSSDLPKINEGEGQNHGDFQVHETVDSAKIKLTFKRNKNNGKKSGSPEVDEMVDTKNEDVCSEYSLVNDLNLEGLISPSGSSNDVETSVSYAEDQNNVSKQDRKGEASGLECSVNNVECLNPPKTYSNDEELMDESSQIENESLVLGGDSSEMSPNHYENLLDESEKRDPQFSLPEVRIFGCDSMDRPENQMDHLLNTSASKISGKDELPDYQECDNVGDATDERNKFENYPSKEDEDGKETVDGKEESTSQTDGGVKEEVAGSERGMDCDTDEKCASDDMDIEVSFINSIEKLADSSLLKSENRVDKLKTSKSPFMPKDCFENSFTETFENGNICCGKDNIGKEPELADYKTATGDDIIEMDTKEMWLNFDDTAADSSEVKKEVILSEMSNPLKELSEEKITDDLLSIDFSSDQNMKDIGFPVNIDDNGVDGSPKHESNGNFSDMFGTGPRHGEDKKLPESLNEMDIDDSRAIDNCDIRRRTEDEMTSTESIQERGLDSQVNKTPIQQGLFTGNSPGSPYLQVTDDNNNNNIRSGNDNSNNNNNNNNNNNEINKSSHNNQGRQQKENVFLTRTVSRRCSCEDQKKEQKQNNERLRSRSKSLNINLTCLECDNKIETEVTDIALKEPVLDIPVSEIPLPPGDAPPENCFNLEKYMKSKLLNNGEDVNIESCGEVRSSPRIIASSVKKSEVEISGSDPKHKFPLLLGSQSLEDLLPVKGFGEFSLSTEKSVPEGNNEQKIFKTFGMNNQEKSDVGAKSVQEKEEDLCKIASAEKSSKIGCKRTPEELCDDLCGIKLPDDCPEYSRNGDGMICGQDVDFDLGESSFRTGGLYECEGLTFDEGLAIADDMEEEKVSDDDKFRNIMQNCLDNAKKFLSEGNLKLFPSRDDFLDIDYFEDQSQDKKQDHISKDVLLASCEKSSSDDLVLMDNQFSDISADFIPSFCSDAGSNLCPEILPVDNWPYLEEEVTSSPLRNKQEDSDLLSSCIENNFRIGSSPLGHWNLLGETDSECVGQRLKNKSRAVSVCVTEGPSLLKATEKPVVQRRRTIESTGRWKSFHSSNEELTKSEDIASTDFTDEKYLLSPNKERTSENVKHSKSRDSRHEKVKKTGVTEESGKTSARKEDTHSEKPKPKSARNSIDFKSSLWQPKVVLFRISKKMIKDLSTLPKRSPQSDSSHKAQMEEDKRVKNSSDHPQKHETEDLNHSSKSKKSMRNDREHLFGKTTESENRSSVDRNRETTSQDVEKKPRTEKPPESSMNAIKRKKNRFRNLCTKKRIVPDTFDLTKDRPDTEKSSNLVDPKESSVGRDLPKQAVFSQCKSTKSESVTKSGESHKKADAERVHHSKHKTEEEEEALKAKRKYKETHRQRVSESDTGKHSSKSRDNKRKREDHESEHEMGSQRKKERNHTREHEKTDHGEVGGGKLDGSTGEEKAKKPGSSSERDHSSKSKNKPNKHKDWKCEVCGFSKSSERVVHIQSHPFHCQSCHLAFKAETNFLDHLTRKHKDIRNQHHCLLCELSFDLEKDYYRHLETREHKHLETVEKNTINTLFTLLTGHPCPVLGHVESKPEWLPTQAGTVHFYHQATPLSLALQYLKLHRDKTATLSTQIE